MRIALNFPRIDPSKGGAETYVVDLCRSLVASGHDVELFANSWKPEALPDCVRTHPVEAHGLTKLQRIWSFATQSEKALIANRARFDCSVGFINTWHHDVIIPQGGVQAATIEANSKRFPAGWRRQAYLLAKRANPKAWIYSAIEARQYDPARGARVVAVSNMVREHLEHHHGVARERIDVVPNAIDANRLAIDDPGSARIDLRSRLGLRPDDLVALFVGHNYALKGLGPLMIALRDRQTRDPSVRPIHLLACGGGKPRRFLELIKKFELERTVQLLGFQPDIRPCFHASDFFVLPTYYDPCSLVVLEALACGLPVITTACNGAGELINEGREGFVIPSPDATERLADALDGMADDDRRNKMAAAARKLGAKQSFDRHVGRLIEVFERASERRGLSFATRSAA